MDELYLYGEHDEIEGIFSRLHEALSSVWDKPRGLNKEICVRTGYSPGHVSGVLNGKVRLDNRFLKLVCKAFYINEHWLDTGEGEMFTQSSSNGDPAANHGTTVHRTLTPDQERALQLLDRDPDGYKLLERYMLLDDESEKMIIRGEIEKMVRERQRIHNQPG